MRGNLAFSSGIACSIRGRRLLRLILLCRFRLAEKFYGDRRAWLTARWVSKNSHIRFPISFALYLAATLKVLGIPSALVCVQFKYIDCRLILIGVYLSLFGMYAVGVSRVSQCLLSMEGGQRLSNRIDDLIGLPWFSSADVIRGCRRRR